MKAFEQQLLREIKRLTPFKDLQEIIEYALLPTGKLFRPNLIHHLAQDLKLKEEAVLPLMLSIECHHAYTLIHDDLPAMDNDSMRRGKPSVHAKFNEGKAILAGDALLVHSLVLLKDLPTRYLELYSWATNGRGLILGQYLDLFSDQKSFTEILRTHELKTSRLMQVATIGTALLHSPKKSWRELKDWMKLGSLIGLIFQLMDDQAELKTEISKHEKEINLFHRFPKEATTELQKKKQELEQKLESLKLNLTKSFLQKYL